MERSGAKLRPRITERRQRRKEMAERSTINDQADVAANLTSRFSKEDAGGPATGCGIAETLTGRPRLTGRRQRGKSQRIQA